MIRDLGQPVSALDLEEDSVIAGGWDDIAKMEWRWDLMWKAQCSDRIESIIRIEDLVVVTSGLHISCLKDGEYSGARHWRFSRFTSIPKGEIVATSSVYDIEHGDFMERNLEIFFGRRPTQR